MIPGLAAPEQKGLSRDQIPTHGSARQLQAHPDVNVVPTSIWPRRRGSHSIQEREKKIIQPKLGEPR